MSANDVFISYARADRETARRFADALTERGYVVWWDFNLVGGADYRRDIENALEASKKVIVLWSETSVASAFVLDEAGHGRDRGKLVPVSVDGARPPFGFGNLHTLTIGHPERDIEALIAAIENRAAPETPPPPRPARRGFVVGATAAAALAAAGGGAYWWREQGGGIEAGPRVALVVGVGAYAEPHALANAKADAKLVAEKLLALGFDVIEEIDPDAARLTRAVDRFQTLLARGGVGLFYYSGHAIHAHDTDILLPLGGEAARSADEARALGVDIAELTGPVEDFFVMSAPGEDMEPDRRRDNGVLLLYAASDREQALDAPPGGGPNSPFAAAFVETLDRDVSELDAVARAVRIAVRDQTGGAQNPVLVDRSDVAFDFNLRTPDPIGILRIVLLDSSRSDPFD